MNQHLQAQMDFIFELDKMKHIVRQNYLANGTRRENDAEHSWHLAIMVLTLKEYFPDADLGKTILLVLIHDIVEIDAGDTYFFDTQEGKRQREEKCADRIFGLLPKEQAIYLRGLWEEFEADITPESHFANVIDRLHPTLLNYASKGKSWAEHAITSKEVLERHHKLRSAPPPFPDLFKTLIQDAVQKKYLNP